MAHLGGREAPHARLFEVLEDIVALSAELRRHDERVCSSVSLIDRDHLLEVCSRPKEAVACDEVLVEKRPERAQALVCRRCRHAQPSIEPYAKTLRGRQRGVSPERSGGDEQSTGYPNEYICLEVRLLGPLEEASHRALPARSCVLERGDVADVPGRYGQVRVAPSVVGDVRPVLAPPKELQDWAVVMDSDRNRAPIAE